MTTPPRTSEAARVVAAALRRVAPECDMARVAPTALLQEAFDIDSVAFLSLVEGLSEAAGIEIPERDFPELATIGGVVAYVSRRWRDAA